MRKQGRSRYTGSLTNPFVVGLELDAQLVVADTQSAVTIAHDGLRHDRLNLLGHHADIGAVAAIVAEPIVAKAVRQMAEQNDIVLEPDIGSSAAATAAEAATATAAETATATAAETAAATAEAAATTAANAGATPRRLETGGSARSDVAERIAAARPLRGPLSCARPLRGRCPALGRCEAAARAQAGPPPPGRCPAPGPSAAGPQDLIAATAAKIHTVLDTATVIIAELLAHVRIVVSHALTVFGRCCQLLPLSGFTLGRLILMLLMLLFQLIPPPQ